MSTFAAIPVVVVNLFENNTDKGIYRVDIFGRILDDFVQPGRRQLPKKAQKVIREIARISWMRQSVYVDW